MDDHRRRTANFTRTSDLTASKVRGNGRNAKLREVFVKKVLPVALPNVGARTTPAPTD